MNKVLSVKVFVLSNLLLLALSLALLAGMFYILNQDTLFRSFVNEYLPVTSKPVSFDLSLNSPEDDLLSFEKSIIVSGKRIRRASH